MFDLFAHIFFTNGRCKFKKPPVVIVVIRF